MKFKLPNDYKEDTLSSLNCFFFELHGSDTKLTTRNVGNSVSLLISLTASGVSTFFSLSGTQARRQLLHNLTTPKYPDRFERLLL
jgi:hypothetical protein